ncbi:MAG TPA: M48 family metallopeptidase, partial [Planctomycetota bacterium]|nr:M48 family metallopeptidase [Planctomycetota bacterium]
MDFFGHQEKARRASGRLVLLFGLAVAGMILCIYAAAMGLLLFANPGGAGDHGAIVFAVVAVSTLAIIGFAMLFKTSQLRSGGGQVARLLGGKPVPLDPTDPKERQLRNVVEEMAIASGVPVPEIYVLDDEPGINAFAAGWSPADAAVAVTRGCLETLGRDELQGVIAHEFSHVFHGDMRLNIRLMGVLFGIVCLATIGRILVRAMPRGGGSGKGKGGAVGIVLFGVALILIGSLGVFFSRLIQAAVSRQREFLADASAVQYTRNPRGIGMALAKIGGLGGRLATPHAEEASHMLFADGMRRFFGGGFATHPPLEQRVERVLPGFLRHLASSGSMEAAVAATPLPPVVVGVADAKAKHAPARAIASAALVQSIGAPEAEHVHAARNVLRELPLDLVAATREPRRAHALVLALLFDRDATLRERQFQLLANEGVELAHEARVQFQAIQHMEQHQRLPLLELAIPALRLLPGTGREQLLDQARAIAMADASLSPFEWALLRCIERHVRRTGEQPRRPPPRPAALLQRGHETSVVLSAIARAGAAGDESLAAQAFARGQRLLQIPVAQLLPAAEGSIAAFDAAIDALADVSPPGKRNLVLACAEAAGADGHLSQDEADLLRALAELW